MGFLSGLGKAGVKTAKVAGKVASGTADVAGKGIAGYGSRIIGNAMKSPLKTAAAIGAAGAAGYMIADADKNPNPGGVAKTAMLGTAAITAIPGAAAVGAGIGMGIVGGAASIGGLALGLGQASVKMPEEPLSFSNMSELKFTPLGKGLVLGAGLYEGLGKAANKFVQGRMGTHDGMMRTATPVIPKNTNAPSYSNNGGATGDLVFAMYNNR